MQIKFQDKDEIQTINKGETYFIGPGHIPIMNEDAVMIEFTQDTTYTTNKNVK